MSEQPETDEATDPIWMMDVGWDVLSGLAFVAVGILIVLHLHALGRRRVPGVAAATAFILFVKGGGHFVHAVLLLWPMPGDGDVMRAARAYAGQGDVWVLDAVAAAAAVSYLTLRARLGTETAGVGLYDDLIQRRRLAMNLHDQVVQQIVQARWSLDLDRADSGAAIASASAAIDNTLDELRQHLRQEEVVAPG